MAYTSGTTGGPKACIHSHTAVGFTAAAQARWYELGDDATMTCFMPLFHVAGMQASMNAGLHAGAVLVLMTRWNRDLIPTLFRRHAVTWWSAAPTMIVDVLASEAFDEGCFESLRVLTGGGAAMPSAVADRLRARFGLAFCEAYGLSDPHQPDARVQGPVPRAADLQYAIDHRRSGYSGAAAHGRGGRFSSPVRR